MVYWTKTDTNPITDTDLITETIHKVSLQGLF